MGIKKVLLNHKNDIILVAFILLISVICSLVFHLTMEDGKYVLVTVDGEQVYKHSIEKDEKTVILGVNSSEQKNVLVIEDGKAFVTSATCPDKICVSHRKISKTGETIVCLPHKVVVSVVEE